MKTAAAPISRVFSWRANILPLLNLGSFIATCIINSLGSVGAFGKGAVGAISDRNPTEIVPAGYAFSIWGLIYALQALMILFQLPMICLGQYPKSISSILSISTPSSTKASSSSSYEGNSNGPIAESGASASAMTIAASNDESTLKSWLRKALSFNIGGQNEMYDRMSIWYACANITNLVWIIVFVYEFFWASFAIIVLLSFLVLCAYVSIGIDYGKRGQARKVRNEIFAAYPNSNEKRQRNMYTWEYWVVQSPFSIYLGWLTAATLLNLFLAVKSTMPAGTTWSNEAYWSVAGQLFAVCCAGALAWLRCDFIYSATVAWALLGIYVKHRDDQNSEVVKIAAVCCFVISLVVAVAAFLTAAYTRFRRLFKKHAWKVRSSSSTTTSDKLTMKMQSKIVHFIGTWVFELKKKKNNKGIASDASSDSSSDDNSSPRYSQTLPV